MGALGTLVGVVGKHTGEAGAAGPDRVGCATGLGGRQAHGVTGIAKSLPKLVCLGVLRED